METESNGTTSINFEVSLQKKNASGEVIDALVSGAKLTKADAGRAAEEWLTITIEEGEGADKLPKVTLNSNSKLTKADAGRSQDNA